MKSQTLASSSDRRRSVISSAARVETLEIRRLLAAQAWDIDSPDVPRDEQGQIVGNYVHELDRSTGRERISTLADSEAADLGILNGSLRSAGFNGVPELINQLGDAKEFQERLTEALDDGSTPASVFGNDDRYQIFAGTTFPWRSIVRIGNNDGTYLGTGAMISPYHVLTAGHVLHTGGPGGSWYTTLQVSPGQTDQNTRPYGQAEWTWARSYTNWTNNSDWNWDWGVITLDRRIGNFTGWMGTEWNGNTNHYNGTTVNLAGYPSDKAVGTMWGANGPITNGDGGQKFRYNGTLDTAPGHSGSPVWRFDGTNRNIVAVHTNGDGGDGFNEATRMTQQKFNDTFGWVNEDNGVRPPTDRPDLLDHDDWFNTNTSSVSPGSVQQGSGINVSFNVRNNGTANASNAVVRYYASTNNIISSGDILLGQTTVNVNAIGTFNLGFNGTVPASTPTGTYFIGWIIDATNTNAEYLENNNIGIHNATIQVTAAPTPDFHEPNNTWATAYNLGTLVDSSYSGLNIHAANNDDYYRLTAGDNGTLNVSLSFLHSQGDVDVSLLNSSGTVLTSSTGTTNSEFISWSVARGVTYGLRVYGYQGATNQSYSMTLDGPAIPLDSYEANDDFGTPADLGAVTSFFNSNLTIHAAGNHDFYRFVAPGDGVAGISLFFFHPDGDVDMALYDDTGVFINSSTGTGNTETINFTAAAGQAYVLQVYGYAGARSWSYSLGITAPADNVAPTVSGDLFVFDQAAHELRIDFSEDVSASIDPSDLLLQNTTTGQTIPTAAIAATYNSGTNTAVFSFPGFANGVLPQGTYSATILAAGVQDASFNQMAANYTTSFNFFAGDTDGNGTIDGADYAVIDANFNLQATLGDIGGYNNGDFDYNGKIDGADYAIIDAAFNAQNRAQNRAPGAIGTTGNAVDPRNGARRLGLFR